MPQMPQSPEELKNSEKMAKLARLQAHIGTPPRVSMEDQNSTPAGTGKSSSSSSDELSVIEAIRNLDKKLDERLDNLTNQFTELKVSIGTDVSTLTKRVGELEAKLDLTTVRVEKLEDVMKMPAEPNKTVLKQLEDMQAQIETLRQQKTNSFGLEHERTMMVGSGGQGQGFGVARE